MQPKILLFAFTVAAFSSCTTAYKSGQTPDDVYYSPVRIETENQDRDQDNDRNLAKQENRNTEDQMIRMRIRDRRWRDFDYDYSYDNSPYHYCTCSCNNYGYYYNPSYHPWPIYLTKVPAPHTIIRTVNLNAYSGYNGNTTVINPKAGNNTGINWIKPTNTSYNNYNYSPIVRQRLGRKSSSSNNSSSSDDSRTYSPSSSEKSSSSSSSSSTHSSSSFSSSSGSSVSRPGRGN